MIQLNNYRIIKSDERNARIEVLKEVKKKDSEEMVKKWIREPDYYNSPVHALEVLLKGKFVSDLLPEEEIDINSLLNKVNYEFNKLKIEIEEK